jgi:tryptophanyl-tRNA synthetase
MKRIYSAAQPTGNIHLGNYFGAIYNWIQLQKEYDCIFSIVDLHALTIQQNPADLNKNIKDLIKLYIAVGLDPKKCIIYRQSDVKEHSELAWILNCITPIAELERMTQYKDKSTQHKKNINAGLLTYPCLMAADIILYNTELVPVGEDQVQHVELARTIAKKFNNQYGETFILPKPLLNKVSARLKGLDDPTKKMSKSASSELNYIALTDSPEIVKKKIKKAVTDSGSTITYEQDKPAIANLMTIYHLVTGLEIKEIEKRFKGKGYGDFKNDLTDRINDFLKPIQERFAAIDENELQVILQTGAKKAEAIAKEKIKEVKTIIGL